MNVRIVRDQLTAAEAQREKYSSDRARVQVQLDEQLARTASSGPFAFDPAAARRLRTEIAGLDQYVADLNDRIEGLARQLPSPEQTAEGRRRCAEHQAALVDAERVFTTATELYVMAADAFEQAARQLGASRQASRAAQIALAEEVSRVGLGAEIAVPDLIAVGRVPPALAKLTHLQALFADGLAAGEEDSQVVRELAAAEAALEIGGLLSA